MTPTSRQLFIKSFWWALIVSALFVGIVLVFVSTKSFFRFYAQGGGLINGILYGSVIGTLVGAGLVGWRVTEKYYHARVKYWTRRYLTLSTLSLALAFVLMETYVLSVLLVFWAPLAAAFVVQAIADRPLYRVRG